MRLSLALLSLATSVLCAPSLLSLRDEDRKIKLGWDGKTITPAELHPGNAVEPTHSKRNLAGVLYVCKDNDWQNCTHIRVDAVAEGQCLGIGGEWNNVISSFGPDAGLKCVLYDNFPCGGLQTPNIVNPGYARMSDINFNDMASAFRCWWA